MQQLPTGTVTFLFTDIEGSTRLWQQYPRVMRPALQRHDAILRAAAEAHAGHVFATAGDAFCIAFTDIEQALLAAQLAQLELSAEAWPEHCPLFVRMAVHTTSAALDRGGYDVPSISSVEGLLHAAHGGQVLVSAASKQLLGGARPEGLGLLELGRYRLDTGAGPREQPIYQLTAEGLSPSHPPLRLPDRHPGRLSEPANAFVGRERELLEISRLLARSRLVTLTGLGGSGKTRLASRAAALAEPDLANGAWLVELAGLDRPEEVASTVAACFGLREDRGLPIQERLEEWLADKRLLLVLDNCEHLLDAVARLARRYLSTAPGLRVLATSREALGIVGEAVYSVGSLPTPSTPRVTDDLEALASNDSVQLFVTRASEHQPGFHLDDRNAASIVEIVRRLDGIPLAIELAAARTDLLSTSDIARRLDDRFRLLSSDDRLVLPRQRTLQATMDWSHALLSLPERALFRRLAVFRGGWSLEAAEAIVSGGPIDPSEVLELLARLAGQSLIVVDMQHAAPRYRLYETVRQYASRQLQESGEEAAQRDAHLHYFLQLAETTEAELRGPDQAVRMSELELEIENLRAALDYAIASGQGALGLRLGGALWYFWWIRGHLQVGVSGLQAVLDLPSSQGTTPERAVAAFGAGSLLWPVGKFDAACERFEECLAISLELEDASGIAGAYNGLGIVANRRGDIEGSRAYFEQSLRLKREIGTDDGIAMLLGNLGVVTQDLGDFEAARLYYQESLALAEDRGDLRAIALATDNLGTVELELGRAEAAIPLHERGLKLRQEIGDLEGQGLSMSNLGMAMMVLGDLEAAAGWFEESLALRRHLGDQFMLAASIEMFGLLASVNGDHDRAARLLGASEARTAAIGVDAMGVADRRRHEQALARARIALGSPGFQATVEAGRGLTMEAALALASADARG